MGDGPDRTAEVHRALEEGRLCLHYQPIVRLREELACGVEALLRWEHPQWGLVSAAQFLPIREDSDAMRAVTAFVLASACAEFAREAPPGWTLSVNITAHDAARPGLVADVESALQRSGLAADRLVLEVTETGVVAHHGRAAQVLGRLAAAGVRIALDDFGTGYSSLHLLRELPVSQLKVDALFVAQVDTNSNDAAIVRNVVHLARSFEAEVVAEGVERPAQVGLLRQLGCSHGQGHLWRRPGPLTSAGQVQPVSGVSQPVPEVVVSRITAMVAEGASPHTVAAALNAAGLLTPEGKRWHAASVGLVLARSQGGPAAASGAT